jgi:hypothetical protein
MNAHALPSVGTGPRLLDARQCAGIDTQYPMPAASMTGKEHAMLLRNLFPLACLGATFAAFAAPPAANVPRLTDAGFMKLDAMEVSVKGRPGEEARLAGLKSYGMGRYAQAAVQFKRAASFADKYSQHYLSLMQWHGVGTAGNPVEAYIWSDLAAERGSPRLLLIREKMWGQLTAAQQQEAVERGADFYAKYGDAAAKPRAEAVMRHFARDMTGSRVGYRNQPLETGGPPIDRILAPEIGSSMGAYMTSLAGSPDELYGKEGGLASLRTYWTQQDQLIERAGTVEVGPPRTVRDTR